MKITMTAVVCELASVAPGTPGVDPATAIRAKLRALGRHQTLNLYLTEEEALGVTIGSEVTVTVESKNPTPA